MIVRFSKDDYADIDPKDLAREIEERSAPPKIYNKKYQASILYTYLPTSTPSNLTSALHAFLAALSGVVGCWPGARLVPLGGMVIVWCNLAC